VALIESLAKQVQQQLRDPIGGRVMVTELDTGHGDLVNDAAAKASIGAAADALHVAAHGE
jgi:hypothetical protein